MVFECVSMVYRLSGSNIKMVSIVGFQYPNSIDCPPCNIKTISMGKKNDCHKPSVHNRLLIPSLTPRPSCCSRAKAAEPCNCCRAMQLQPGQSCCSLAMMLPPPGHAVCDSRRKQLTLPGHDAAAYGPCACCRLAKVAAASGPSWCHRRALVPPPGHAANCHRALSLRSIGPYP